MPILQFRCVDCASVFEQMFTPELASQPACLSCSSFNISRLSSSFFYANKTFCPHDKVVDLDVKKFEFASLMGDRSQGCAGCGVDGPAGSCGTKNKSCGNCTCGKGGCGNKM